MSKSVSNQLLLDAFANCVRERYAKDALDRLCDALEIGLQSSDDPRIELFEALTNYVYQLRDGAIQATVTTTSLFQEAQMLLDEESFSQRGVSFGDKVANLLERIDLEASGGFDALEAGEVPEFDGSGDVESETVRVQNTLHRLRASLESIEHHAQEQGASVSSMRLFLRHQHLLDSLAPTPLTDQALPLTTIEELLTLHPIFSNVDLIFDEEGSVHPTYIPLLSSLITQLANTLSITKFKNARISRKQHAIEIQMTLGKSDTRLSDLRATAIEEGLLHADAPLHDGAEIQYLLLPESVRANKPLIQSSELIDQLQTLCANVVVEATDESYRVTTSVPPNIQMEEATVFKLNGARYAVLNESIAEVIYSSKTDTAEARSSIDSEHTSYRVSNLNKTNGNHEACLLIHDGGNRNALFVDQLEPSGQLPVFDPLSENSYIGGGVRLLDGRLVILLSSLDLDDSLTSTSRSRIGVTTRILVLGSVPLSSQLPRRVYEVSIADGELNATAAIQEQRPHAILVEQNELSAYGNVLSQASQLSIRVIVQQSGFEDIEIEGWRDDFKSISSLTELEVLLKTLAANHGQ